MTFKKFSEIIPRIQTEAQSRWFTWTLAKYLGDQKSIDRINATYTAFENCQPKPPDRVRDLEKRITELEEIVIFLTGELEQRE